LKAGGKGTCSKVYQMLFGVEDLQLAMKLNYVNMLEKIEVLTLTSRYR
jgi:hypothetical protein